MHISCSDSYNFMREQQVVSGNQMNLLPLFQTIYQSFWLFQVHSFSMHLEKLKRLIIRIIRSIKFTEFILFSQKICSVPMFGWLAPESVELCGLFAFLAVQQRLPALLFSKDRTARELNFSLFLDVQKFDRCTSKRFEIRTIELEKKTFNAAT